LLVFFLIFLSLNASTLDPLNESPSLKKESPLKKDVPSGFLEHTSSVVEVTRKSWAEKFEESFYLCILGAILFICAFPALWFNERRAVRTTELITDGLNNCYELDPNILSPEKNGKLVYLSGMAECPEPLKDELIGVTIEKTLKMNRKVEMFQYKEETKTSNQRDMIGGGETTITTNNYKLDWEEMAIDSSKFKDPKYVNTNPKFIIEKEIFYAKASHIGEYDLAKHQLESLVGFKIFYLQENSKSNFSLDFMEKIKGISSLEKIFVVENYIYIKTATGNENQDSIGDLRISFQYVPEENISLVSGLNDKSFLPYSIKKKGFKEIEETKPFIEKPELNVNLEDEESENCCLKCCPCCICCIFCIGIDSLCKSPTTINWLFEKQCTKNEIFEFKEKENRLATWCLRIGGFLMMVFGISLFFSPVYEILQILPILSYLGKLVVFMFALIVSIPLTSLIIMMAWLSYRPKVAFIFFLIVVVFGVLLYIILRKNADLPEGF